MFNFIPSAGYAVASLDFTTLASPLLAGLVALVWLLAGLIAVLALREQFAQSGTSLEKTVSEEIVYRHAA